MRIASIAVLIVNYKTAALPVKAVQTVLDHTHGGREVHVHVVDNASPDDSVHLLQQAHRDKGWDGRVTLYPEAENHGFGRGNNVVLRQLAQNANPPDAVFFLNPDATVQSGTINALVAQLEQLPDTGVCGCRIMRPDGTFVPSAFRFPTVFGEFLSGLGIGRLFRLFRLKRRQDLSTGSREPRSLRASLPCKK